MKLVYFVITFSALVTSCYSDEKIECRSGEVWSDCQPACGERNCDNLKARCKSYYETKVKCTPGCYCDKGNARQIGKCIPIKKCKTCSRPNEEYSCADCQTICAEIVHNVRCPIVHVKCDEGCYCMKGYARLDAKSWGDTSARCVPYQYCPKDSQGPAVETEHCGGPISGTWECIYGSGNPMTGPVPADRPEIIAEIGPGCRCGCIVHLGSSKPRRLIASSSQSCPGRTFWLIQADAGHRVRFKTDFFRLPCPTQWLKIRDGDSLSSELIAEYIGGNGNFPEAIISTESQILLEFFSDELSTLGQLCGGGFLAHAQQIEPAHPYNVTLNIPSQAVIQASSHTLIAVNLTIVHIVAILFVSIIIVISILLGTQYLIRYRKYQLAESSIEPDSPAHTPRQSVGSIHASRGPSRAVSTTTLLSEVISLVRMRPRPSKMKHSRLRESVDVENIEKSEGGGCDADKSYSDDDCSIGSTHTLTNENLNDLDNPARNAIQIPPNSNDSLTSEAQSGSPPSNSLSLPLTPQDTPIPLRRLPTRDKYNSDTKSMNGKSRKKKLRDVSPVREEDTTETDTDSIRISMDRRSKALSASNATLTNGCYSPASSMISRAKIKATNPKESKEKKNREKLLAGPGSEFSLVNPEDMELDYYDYNVMNAGAAPGSYLGMDPAYLVWIPPIDEGNIIGEVEDEDRLSEPYYEEILPRIPGVDPGSNTETPEQEEAPQLPVKNRVFENESFKNVLNNKNIAASSLTLKGDVSPKMSRRGSNTSSNLKQKSNLEGIQLSEFTSIKCNKFSSPARTHLKKSNDIEKETAVVKSPSDNINDYYDIDDIQFADDDDDDDCSGKDEGVEKIDLNKSTGKNAIKT